MAPPLPSLPQDGTPAQQQQRRSELAQQQQVYTYDFNTRLAPLGFATRVPEQDEASFAWSDEVVTTGAQLLGNFIGIGTKFFDNGQAVQDDASMDEPEVRQAESLYQQLSTDFLVGDLRQLLESLVLKLVSTQGERLLKRLGIHGKADSITRYADLFSRIPVPSIAHFPDEEWYAVFEGMPTGKTSGGQKYLSAPLALFAVPTGTTSDRRLRAVAIQCSQRPGPSSPVFTPGDGTLWALARLHVQVADSNHHELISHLGLTHLVMEAFAMATPRQLSSQHPLFLLLTPHLQGTLLINNLGESLLIAPGGSMDTLLAGQLAASIQVSVQAAQNHSINQAFLPQALAVRGVDDPEKLPDYPYRDDGLLLWEDIRSWVNDYLSIYYNGDAAVRSDSELQAWIAELASPDVGKLKDIGELGGGIQTLAYLVDLVTYIIFTASVQHAAVNYPQRTLMSYTPVFPLAAYAPAPARTAEPPPARAVLAYLPPLQMAFGQLVLMYGLGNVYFSRLGDYGSEPARAGFSDARVTAALQAFQERLRVTQQEIERRNRSRLPYETLLPSAIPQSINI